MVDFKKLEIIKDKVLQFSCTQCFNQVTEMYKLKEHAKCQSVNYTEKYFAGKAVELVEIMPTQDTWNSQYFESFQLLFIVNLKIFSKWVFKSYNRTLSGILDHLLVNPLVSWEYIYFSVSLWYPDIPGDMIINGKC